MGEAARRKKLNGATNGHTAVSQEPKHPTIRVVPNVALENPEGSEHIMLMVGETEPELAVELTLDHARSLIQGLEKHIAARQKERPVIVLPGDILP